VLLLLLPACAGSSSTPPRAAATATTALACAISTPISVPAVNGSGLQTTVAVPGHPFASVASPSGQWIFVSLDGDQAGAGHLAVLQRTSAGGARLAHLLALPDTPLGLALTHDGQQLIVADNSGVVVLDTARAEAGADNAVLGSLATGPQAGTIEVAVSPDDHFVFATNEYSRQSMVVIDLRAALSDGFVPAAQVGAVPLDYWPLGMAFSPDGRSLYVTSYASQEAVSLYGRSALGVAAGTHAVGTLSVVDVARAVQDPAQAVIGRAWAGCGPVRVALSASGDVAWVTAQVSNALLAFSTAKLLSDPQHALLATVPVGPDPTGLLLVNGGADVLVANSNRVTGGTSPETLSVVNTQRALAGQPAVTGSIPVGMWPRELASVGQLAILTNFMSDSISLIDTAKLP
jgi:DNA-binding beta-propeller fold protein YncE